MDGALQLFSTFVDQWKTGAKAEVNFFCEGGNLKVKWCADLGPWRASADDMMPKVWGVGSLHKAGPSRMRRRQRRAASRYAAGGESFAAEKAAIKTPEDSVKGATESVADQEVAAKAVDVEVPAAEKAAVQGLASQAATSSAEGIWNTVQMTTTAETRAGKAAVVQTDTDNAESAVVMNGISASETGNCSPSKSEHLASTSCAATRCWNCDEEMSAAHQCDVPPLLPPPKAKEKTFSAPYIIKGKIRMLDGSPAFPPRLKRVV